jgi:hypothetical protein
MNLIYIFENMLDPCDTLYGIKRGNKVGVAGFAMVRFDTEISVLCVAGETEDLIKVTKQLKESNRNIKITYSRENIQPDASLSIEAVPLKSRLPLWKLVALTRFDVSEMSRSVRYICHDIGNAFSILTDDPIVFLDYKGNFINKDMEVTAQESAQNIGEYNTLFDLCSTALFLPLYFDKFAEDIFVERSKTKYADMVGKATFSKIKKNIPHNIKIAYRNVNVLRANEHISNTMATLYSIPNFHVQTSGYWRNLESGKVGSDKTGAPIHGRTWVSKKLSWMEADELGVLVAERSTLKAMPEGPMPGFIYVMHSPLHPINVFKVGYTQISTEVRANELSNATGLPGRIYVMHEWAVGDCVSIERVIHNRLADYRIDPRREFFEVPLSKIFTKIFTVIEEVLNLREVNLF